MADCALHRQVDEQFTAILNELSRLKTAFPEDESGEYDLAGHRRYHDAQIAAAKAEEAFWRDLKLDLAKKGVWAIVLVLIGLLVTGLAAKLGWTWK